MSPEQRRQAAGSWRQAMAPYLERRTGPRKVALDPAEAPALLWSPLLPGIPAGPSLDRFVRETGSAPDRFMNSAVSASKRKRFLAMAR